MGQISERKINNFFRNLAESEQLIIFNNFKHDFSLEINTIDIILVCAAHPMAILVPGILITAGLACGIVYLDITTDPVELWASPTSRSRLEKVYFDENFSPFYRTEQIIVTAKGLSEVSYRPSNNSEEDAETYGPIFNKEFMYALLDLQERILNDVSKLYKYWHIIVLIVLPTPNW